MSFESTDIDAERKEEEEREQKERLGYSTAPGNNYNYYTIDAVIFVIHNPLFRIITYKLNSRAV